MVWEQTIPAGQVPPQVPVFVTGPHGCTAPTHWHEMPSGVTHARAFEQKPLQEGGFPPQMFPGSVVDVIVGQKSDVVVVSDVLVDVLVVGTMVIVVVWAGAVEEVVVVGGLVEEVVVVGRLVEVVAPGMVVVVETGRLVDVVGAGDVVVVKNGIVVIVVKPVSIVVVVLVVVVVEPSQQSPSIGASTCTSRRLHAVRTLMAPVKVPSFLKCTQRTSACAEARTRSTTTTPPIIRMCRPYARRAWIANAPVRRRVVAGRGVPYPAFVEGSTVDRAARARELADFLRGWAELELRGYAPLYDRVARALADEPALLARVADVAPREKLVPVLLFAAVRHLVLADPAHPLAVIHATGAGDPWPPFRRLLETRFDEVAGLVAARSIQTNEVGRASAVLPALGLLAVEQDRPLALIEVGASAGLNLNLDRFAYDFDGAPAGDPDSAVRLACRLLGGRRPPLPAAPLPIASRIGIDLAPIDAGSDEACRWLEACVWPGITPRAERLRAAIALARRHPPRVLAGDATSLLPEVLATLPAGVTPCIVSTWVLAYLSAEGRARLAAAAAAASAGRDVAWITLEYAGVPPWLPAPPTTPPDEPGAANLLSLTTWRDGAARVRTLAWVHSHGAWLGWLA